MGDLVAGQRDLVRRPEAAGVLGGRGDGEDRGGEHGEGGWVGPGRLAGVAPGRFPWPALRTRRAIFTAPGSPRALAAGLAGGGRRSGCPRGRYLGPAVAVAGDRHG